MRIADKYRKPILPLRLENVGSPSELEYCLIERQRLDVFMDRKKWLPNLRDSLGSHGVTNAKALTLDDPSHFQKTQKKVKYGFSFMEAGEEMGELLDRLSKRLEEERLRKLES